MTVTFILAAIAASVLPLLAQTADEPSALPKGATPRDIQTWARQVSVAYPNSALREQLQGREGVNVKIDKSGRVTRFFVVKSSSHPVLDKAACLAMLRHAMFNPALDADGNRALGSHRTNAIFRIDETPLPDQIPLKGQGREITPPPPRTDPSERSDGPHNWLTI